MSSRFQLGGLQINNSIEMVLGNWEPLKPQVQEFKSWIKIQKKI